MYSITELFNKEIRPLMNKGEWYTAEKLKFRVKPLNEQGKTIAEILSYVFNHSDELIRNDADKISFSIPRGQCTWAYKLNVLTAKVEESPKTPDLIQGNLDFGSDNVIIHDSGE